MEGRVGAEWQHGYHMVNIWNGKSVWMLMCGEAQVDLLH